MKRNFGHIKNEIHLHKKKGNDADTKDTVKRYILIFFLFSLKVELYNILFELETRFVKIKVTEK